MKDPAFLFYSQDFYSGTRLMMPNERACYIDLLIYQHQNDFIPNDLDRLLMFCSGVDKATLEATLEAKFKRCDKGWYNERLMEVINDRKEFKDKLSYSGKIGQFWKKIKALTDSKNYKKIKDFIYSKDSNYLPELLNKIDLKNKTSLEGWLKASLKHLENEDENENEDNNKKGTVNLFSEYIKIFNSITGRNFREVDSVKKKFNARIKEGFSLDDFEKAIKNASNDKWMKENTKYLTPEYIARADKLDKWLNTTIKQDYKINPESQNNPERLSFQ